MTNNGLKLSGVIPPMITPLTAQGEVDSEGLERLVNHMLEGGVSGIFTLGSSGEGPWLTVTEQNKVLQEVIRCVDGRVPVLAGALEPNTSRTAEAIKRLVDAGADIVVIASPYYYASDASVQIRHVETLVAASEIPVMLYNIPPTTHNPIMAETVQQVMQLENLIGIKDSAGDWDNFLTLLKYREQRPDFAVFQGAEKLSAKSLVAGADGIVPGLGNIIPGHFVAIYEAIQSGKPVNAESIQKQVDELWKLHSYDFWLVCLKYAAGLLGFGSGATVGHTMHMNQDAQQAIAALVQKVRNEAIIGK